MTAATPPEQHHPPNDLVSGLGEDFEVEPGEHFRLIHDVSQQSAQVLVDRLDQTYDAVARFLKRYELEVRPPSAPLMAVLFGHKADYDRYVRQNELPFGASSGFFSPAQNLAVFWDIRDHPAIRLITERIKQLRESGAMEHNLRPAPSEGERTLAVAMLRAEREALVRRFNDLVVAHEAAHQVLYNLGFPVLGSDGPAWLVEGLACQFEVAQPHLANGHVVANPMRQADFRTAWGVDREARTITADQHRRAVESGRMLPLSDVIGTPQALTGIGDRSAFRYAQFWALVFYLHHKHHERFARFLKVLTSRPSKGAIEAIQQFKAVIGPLNAAWERSMTAFILKGADAAPGP